MAGEFGVEASMLAYDEFMSQGFPTRNKGNFPSSVDKSARSSTREHWHFMEPPMTKWTLSEPDANLFVYNPELRHDINFDPDLHFRPNLEGEKGRRKTQKANDFWETMTTQLQNYIIYRDRSEKELGDIGWCLPATLKTIRGILGTLVPQRDHAAVEETFNVDLLMQQFRKGEADLEKLALWLSQLLKCHCAPMRENWVDQMCTQLINGDRQKDVRMLVGGMQNLLGVLEAMKLDVANHQFRCLRPLLIEDTVQFEQKFFMKKIALGRVDIAGAHAWSRRASSIPDIPPTDGSDHAQGNTWDFMKTLVNFTLPSKSSEIVPHAFLFDEERLIRLRSDMLDLVNLEICMHLYLKLDDPDTPVPSRPQLAKWHQDPYYSHFGIQCGAGAPMDYWDFISARNEVKLERLGTHAQGGLPPFSWNPGSLAWTSLLRRLRRFAPFVMVSLVASLFGSVSASEATDSNPGSMEGKSHKPASFQKYFEELLSNFTSIQAGPILTHIIWALALSGCYLVIKRANKTAERPASLAALILLSEVASLFGGYKYHPTPDIPAGYESEMTDTALIIAMLFNGALTTLYSKSTLDKFKLGRLHTGLIIIVGALCAYVSAASALWLLDDVKGRYSNKTALFLTLVMPWTAFVGFMYLSALADTPLGRRLDEGRYIEGLTSFVRYIFRGGDAGGRNAQRSHGRNRGRNRGRGQTRNVSA